MDSTHHNQMTILLAPVLFVPKSYDERISIAGHSYDVWKAGEKGKSKFNLIGSRWTIKEG
jgi:hypothetical protein